ncbi:nucleoside/nucleotide kinase family protein [Streptomyces katsurahamanus]|uniref:hypothetical protein n=1 Tax=Streptomyces katsurahamanus TaxID=2577098 RepID=UPI001E4A2B2D|nr:hypothetical protein [Streptomyces katsurahamanus]
MTDLLTPLARPRDRVSPARRKQTPAASDRPFYVLLGPDGAGKSSVLTEVGNRLPGWRMLSTDDDFAHSGHPLISRLRRDVVQDVLPGLGTHYSPDFLACLLQTAVVHLRDQLARQPGELPLLMDSYYYKILAKCRLAGIPTNPMYAWWRSFPQPRAVLYLDVSPASAWRRSGNGARLNPLEYFGERPEWPGFESYQRSLRELMLEEVRELPVTVIGERSCVNRTADAVTEVLAA